MKKVSIIILGLLFCIGCQDLDPVKKPDNLIGKETMKEITFDLAMVNAARGFNPQKLVRNKIKPECYIFDKYGIDSVQFVQSTTYYATRLEEYRDIYQTVKNRLDTLHAYHDSIERTDKKIKDSIRNAKSKAAKKRLDSIKGQQPDTDTLINSSHPTFTRPNLIEQQPNVQLENDG